MYVMIDESLPFISLLLAAGGAHRQALICCWTFTPVHVISFSVFPFTHPQASAVSFGASLQDQTVHFLSSSLDSFCQHSLFPEQAQASVPPAQTPRFVHSQRSYFRAGV